MNQEDWDTLRLAAEESRGYFRTDPFTELTDTIETAAQFATCIAARPSNWKWFIIALHNGLQGACACSLKGYNSSGIDILRENTRIKMLDWFNRAPGDRMPRPEPDIAPMLVLYERIKRPSFVSETVAFQAGKQIDRDVRSINSLRNSLTHFAVDGLSIELAGLPRIIRSCCTVVDHLVFKQCTFVRHMEEEHFARISAALALILQMMDRIEYTVQPVTL